MGLIKLPDSEFEVHGHLAACQHPEHNPPMHAVLEPGTYKYDCPGCGSVQIFTIDPRARMG